MVSDKRFIDRGVAGGECPRDDLDAGAGVLCRRLWPIDASDDSELPELYECEPLETTADDELVLSMFRS